MLRREIGDEILPFCAANSIGVVVYRPKVKKISGEGVMDERVAESIRRHLDAEGMLPCAMAFRVAEELGVDSLVVGQTADEIGIRLNRCQLGLFGYGPKAEGRHKIVRPAETVEPGLAQAIHDNLIQGRLTCRSAWEIAAVLGIPKLDVSAAAEALGARITQCQLGAF